MNRWDQQQAGINQVMSNNGYGQQAHPLAGDVAKILLVLGAGYLYSKSSSLTKAKVKRALGLLVFGGAAFFTLGCFGPDSSWWVPMIPISIAIVGFLAARHQHHVVLKLTKAEHEGRNAEQSQQAGVTGLGAHMEYIHHQAQFYGRFEDLEAHHSILHRYGYTNHGHGQ